MSYWLSESGQKLRSQLDRRWPKRDKASDGWIGDSSHAAVPSDHNPCWSCDGERYGVVRAIDIDNNFGDAGDAQKFASQLIALARAGKDGGRLSYVIFNGAIASGTYASTFWTWRTYTGSDPHTNHLHVSFKSAGDLRGGAFDLPIFDQTTVPQRLLEARDDAQRRIERLKRRAAKIDRELKRERTALDKLRGVIAGHKEN